VIAGISVFKSLINQSESHTEFINGIQVAKDHEERRPQKKC